LRAHVILYIERDVGRITNREIIYMAVEMGEGDICI